MNYITLSEHYRRRFGRKVYKLSLQSGCSCPNRDGNIGFEGVYFVPREEAVILPLRCFP